MCFRSQTDPFVEMNDDVESQVYWTTARIIFMVQSNKKIQTQTQSRFCHTCHQPSHNRSIPNPLTPPINKPREDLLTDILAWTTQTIHNTLARTTLVNSDKKIVYDTYIYDTDAPIQNITCEIYKSSSGIEKYHLQPSHGAVEFGVAKSTMLRLMRGRTIVTHAGKKHLVALRVREPEFLGMGLRGWRDVQLCGFYARHFSGHMPGPTLRELEDFIAGGIGRWRRCRGGFQDSIGDAEAVLECFEHKRAEMDEEQVGLHLGFDAYIRRGMSERKPFVEVVSTVRKKTRRERGDDSDAATQEGKSSDVEKEFRC